MNIIYFQFGGAFMLKAPAYQMVEENSKRSDSFFYSIEHESRKSIFNAYNLLAQVPYMKEGGLPGN
jgi:hypothetical protein